MSEYEEDSGGEENPTAGVSQNVATTVDQSVQAAVKQWTARVKESKAYFADDFKRMKECIKLARNGTSDDDWAKGNKYVTPILNRHINQAVSRLYARRPRAVVNRRPKVHFKLWDGSVETAQAAVVGAQMGDPMAMQILQEILAAREQVQMLDTMAKTLEVVDDYFMSEQEKSYKKQIKNAIRRAKVTGVAYGMLGFQRLLGQDQDAVLDRDAQISDIRQKIARAEEISLMGEDGNLDETAAEVEELRSILLDLETPETIVVREGPVMSFPRATQVIIDKGCRDLATLVGAKWLAIEYDMTPERIRQEYGADVRGDYSQYSREGDLVKPGETDKNACAKVWVIYDKVNLQVLTICDGYPDWLSAPKEPDVKIDGFYPVFPLVFNNVEADDSVEGATIYPPSDVWQGRHPQDEYNRSREGLREHRIASKPYYVTPKSALEEADKSKLGEHAAHELIELNIPMESGFDIARIVQRGPAIPIDPNLYEVENIFSDVLRAVGTQEANIGGVAGGTATESSIAESSRMSSIEENVDDLDDWLGAMAHARGQLYFMELSFDTVMEIAGEGATWPDMPLTREQASKDLSLSIKAGSSGRPNAAAELANMERAMPFLLQIPGLNPKPYADRYAALLDIETDEATAEGLPSITALNAMMTAQSGMVQPGTGDPASDPAAQGGEGGQNAPSPAGVGPGAQPAYPAEDGSEILT